jgi:hypothetical protein
LFLIGAAIYLGLLILFAWQTWSFVDWLFPSDQVLMKILTVLCFDIMALFWACVDLFYRFASRGARSLVRWAWAVSFILSLLASIFYLVIESMFRFQITISQQTVNTGYGITIGALTLNILFLTFFLYLEWLARHPHNDEFVDDDDQQPVQAPVPAPVSQPAPAPQSAGLTISDVVQVVKSMQPPPAYHAPDQNQAQMQAWLKQFFEEERARRASATPEQPTSDDYRDAMTPVPVEPSYADDLADSVPPAQRETQYDVVKRPQPDTDHLPKAAAPAPNGAKLNGK